MLQVDELNCVEGALMMVESIGLQNSNSLLNFPTLPPATGVESVGLQNSNSLLPPPPPPVEDVSLVYIFQRFHCSADKSHLW